MEGTELVAARLELVFARCFEQTWRTVLVGGGDEPLYEPASGDAPARIVYAHDYFASALHEVAHWCIAGRKRLALVDYGYWYSPDGRGPAQQAEFERVEVRPQALESLFAEACGSRFVLSADNLDGGGEPGPGFADAVSKQRSAYRSSGLRGRAAIFHDALLAEFVSANGRLSSTQ